MAAGLAMLELIQAPGFHADIERRTNVLCDGLEAAAGEAGVALTTQRVGGMFGLFFSDEKVDTYAQAVACDSAAFNRFFHAMLERGVYLAPSAYEAGFMSRSEEHTSELQSLMRISYAVFCLKKKKQMTNNNEHLR